jgi:hypothetical protein
MSASKHNFQSFIPEKHNNERPLFETYQAIKNPEPLLSVEAVAPNEAITIAYDAGFQAGLAQALLESHNQRRSDDLRNYEALRLANKEMLEAETSRLAKSVDAQIQYHCNLLENAIAQILECWLVKQAQAATIATLAERIGNLSERSTKLQITVSGRSELITNLADQLANSNVEVFTVPSTDSELTIYARDTKIETCLQSIVSRISGSSN